MVKSSPTPPIMRYMFVSLASMTANMRRKAQPAVMLVDTETGITSAAIMRYVGQLCWRASQTKQNETDPALAVAKAIASGTTLTANQEFLSVSSDGAMGCCPAGVGSINTVKATARIVKRNKIENGRSCIDVDLRAPEEMTMPGMVGSIGVPSCIMLGLILRRLHFSVDEHSQPT